MIFRVGKYKKNWYQKVKYSFGKIVGKQLFKSSTWALALSLLLQAIDVCLLNAYYLYLFPLHLFITLWSLIPRILKLETENWNKINKQQNQGANLGFRPLIS